LPSLNTFAKEIAMQSVITIGRELVPVEQIAYVEPFEPPANGQFKPDKPYTRRVVLLNRETVLTETAPQEFAEAHGFRLLPEDNVATNPAIAFRVESFAPTDGFNPAKPYETALCGAVRTPTATASCCSRNPKW
jgi:hypothetical protein